jgi:hypothetical protein
MFCLACMQHTAFECRSVIMCYPDSNDSLEFADVDNFWVFASERPRAGDQTSARLSAQLPLAGYRSTHQPLLQDQDPPWKFLHQQTLSELRYASKYQHRSRIAFCSGVMPCMPAGSVALLQSTQYASSAALRAQHVNRRRYSAVVQAARVVRGKCYVTKDVSITVIVLSQYR